MSAVLVPASPATMPTPVRLLATYVLKGTESIVPVSDERDGQLATRYISGTYGDPPKPLTIVNYPASFFPITPGFVFDPTLDQSVAAGVAQLRRDSVGDPEPVIFGISQGALVVTAFKRSFNEQYANPAPGTAIPRPTWVVTGNPNRANGGTFARFEGLYLPFLDVTLTGATPTHTAGAAPDEITTFDISTQYDLASDLPLYPLNPWSLTNAIAGFFFAHTAYSNYDMTDAVLQDRYGDTAYYLIPSARLPLLVPFALVGVPDPILAVLDAPLRVLVEAGYVRTISPGEPTRAGLIPQVDPLQVATNFLAAIPTGLDDGFEQLGLGRPLGTAPAGPYGVGGPPVTLPGNAPTTLATEMTTHEGEAKPPALSGQPESPAPARPPTNEPPDDHGVQTARASSDFTATEPKTESDALRKARPRVVASGRTRLPRVTSLAPSLIPAKERSPSGESGDRDATSPEAGAPAPGLSDSQKDGEKGQPPIRSRSLAVRTTPVRKSA